MHTRTAALMTGISYIILLLLLALSLLPRLSHGYRLNQTYLWLVDYVSTDVVWVEHAIFGPSDIQELEEIGQLFLQNKWPESKTSSLSELHASTSLFKTLALINTLRQREQLAAFFTAMDSISDGKDIQGISTLSKMQASGVLLAVGISFMKEDLDLALDYLEAAFELQPTSYPILRQLVEIYLVKERYCDLRNYAQIGIKVYDSGVYYYFLGRAYEGLGDWISAVEAYEFALERYPGYAPYERLLSRSIERADKGYTSDSVMRCD